MKSLKPQPLDSLKSLLGVANPEVAVPVRGAASVAALAVGSEKMDEAVAKLMEPTCDSPGSRVEASSRMSRGAFGQPFHQDQMRFRRELSAHGATVRVNQLVRRGFPTILAGAAGGRGAPEMWSGAPRISAGQLGR